MKVKFSINQPFRQARTATVFQIGIRMVQFQAKHNLQDESGMASIERIKN